MSLLLNKDEKRQVFQALDGKISYKRLADPNQWHQFAWNWNWDDGFKPLQWIIRQKDCDKGTALFIYWHAAPDWFCQYTNRDEVISQRQDVELYDFIKEIEAKYINNFYTRENIRFDPRNDNGYNWTNDYGDLKWQQDIPKEMMQPSPGELAQREELIEAVIHSLTEAENQKVQRKITKGFSIIKKYHPTITSTSEPASIVSAVEDIIEQYSKQLDLVEQLRRSHTMMNLGWTWADQLCRAYSWSWQCWEADDARNLSVLSPNQLYASFPPNIVAYTLNVRPRKTQIRTLFEQLENVQKTQDLSEAYACGWIFLNTKAL